MFFQAAKPPPTVGVPDPAIIAQASHDNATANVKHRGKQQHQACGTRNAVCASSLGRRGRGQRCGYNGPPGTIFFHGSELYRRHVEGTNSLEDTESTFSPVYYCCPTLAFALREVRKSHGSY